jgi:hypothetical protein
MNIKNKQDVLAALKDSEFQKLCSISDASQFESYFVRKHGSPLRILDGGQENVAILHYPDGYDDEGWELPPVAVATILAETKSLNGEIKVSRSFNDPELPFRVSFYVGVAAITEYLDDQIVDETLGEFKTVADALLGAQIAFEMGNTSYDLEELVVESKLNNRKHDMGMSI